MESYPTKPTVSDGNLSHPTSTLESKKANPQDQLKGLNPTSPDMGGNVKE